MQRGTAPFVRKERLNDMPITDLLERNSKLYGDEIALVEINPEVQEKQRVTWKEYELIQPTSTVPYRREITWSVFDEKANRVANMLLGRGIQQGPEGGHPADELPGVAAHLLRHSEGRGRRRAL